MIYWLIGILFFATVVILFVGKLEWDEKISVVEIESQKVSAVTVVETNSKPSVTLPSTSKIKPVKLAILSSASTPEDKEAWPSLLAQELKTKAGSTLIEVTVKEIRDKTSDEVVRKELYKALVNPELDILLIEPFLLYDNSKIKMARRLENRYTKPVTTKRKKPNCKVCKK